MVLSLAKLWNIRLLCEEELPQHRKNVIKCEDQGSAFIELKKRKFFQNLDMTKVDTDERVEVIHNTLRNLDHCHKQTQRFIRENGRSVVRTEKDLKENMLPSDEDSNYDKEDGTSMRTTVLDGVNHAKFKEPADIWKNQRIMNFINRNSPVVQQQ